VCRTFEMTHVFLGAGRSSRMGCDDGVYSVFLDGLESGSGEMSLFFSVLLWNESGGVCSTD
jgi:hypothetical protein